MFYSLGEALQQYFGPFRLLTSHLFLIATGLYLAFGAVMILLPRSFARLPVDRGREFAAQAQTAKGKPTGAGIVFVPIFVVIALCVVPFSFATVAVLGLTVLICLAGFLDDTAGVAWGEYLKGGIDLVLAVAASLVLAATGGTTLWLPFTDAVFTVPVPVFVCIGSALIWVSINSTNCSDGVDGLSATLALIGLVSLGAILYGVLGNASVSKYLLLPFVKNGASWAIMAFALVGALSAYLWYNAFPSRVLMGDAGSRALGFLIGVFVLVTGNPFLVFVLATMLLVNGGTGLVKVALLRFLKIRVFRNTRFPLHDHVRESRKWSNPQVLLKFAIIQILVTVGILGVFLKIR